ncbi:glycosyltransferase [uncultured Jatrophihabitans sp.]|uniref:glycosyltransferase n=1 Tax=uncultured Jatrophihabitans sp. TaxID=1610747 RepID=UPI0035CB2B31
MTFNPLFAGFGDHAGFRAVTYVARDDWSASSHLAHLAGAFDTAYERIRDKRIRVSAVSQVLLDRLSPHGAGIVVPNGVDTTTWGPARPTPKALEGLPRPLAMYTGTIDSRLSIPALRSLASTLVDGSIVLVGPSDATAAARIRAALPDVVFFSPVGQEELAGLVRSADVCVIPHVRSALTEAMSPLKLYEYVAAGRPVAATDLPPMRGVHPSVVLCESDAMFGTAAAQALHAGPLSEFEREDFMVSNTWEARCQRILSLAVA